MIRDIESKAGKVSRKVHHSGVIVCLRTQHLVALTLDSFGACSPWSHCCPFCGAIKNIKSQDRMGNRSFPDSARKVSLGYLHRVCLFFGSSGDCPVQTDCLTGTARKDVEAQNQTGQERQASSSRPLKSLNTVVSVYVMRSSRPPATTSRPLY